MIHRVCTAVLVVCLAGCVTIPDNRTAVYVCDNNMEITAEYSESGASLVIDGVPRNLYQTMSASGARYASENGITGGRGVIWWIKGSEASLYEMILDHTVPPGNYPLITRCHTG